jgi:multidrug efflux pump subunit AcrA (membrane-fusion protein)
MEPLITLAISFTLAAILSSLGVGLLNRRARAQVEPPSLEKRLRDLGDLVRSSSRVLEEVQAEIQARVALAERAKQDAEEAEQVAQLNEAQRAAIARLVRAEVATEVERGNRRSFWQGVGINFSFFVAGGLVSFLVTVWFEP